METDPKISVIIPTFRNREFLKLCLPEYLKTPGCEVIVGLDGFNREYLEWLEGQPVTISLTRKRQGLCTATNLAAGLARGEYLFCCNDDMVPGPGWEKPLLLLAERGGIVSASVWEPGLIEVPPSHRKIDLGHDPQSFQSKDFQLLAGRELEAQGEASEPGINYPFLISAEAWRILGGLDERFNPGSASDPDLFIRAALSNPAPAMVRAGGSVFYHFAGRSGIYAGGRVSLWWKLHRRHSLLMFRRKWGRRWQHHFGQVPDISGWKALRPAPEPWLSGRLWRLLSFGPAGPHQVIRGRGWR